VSWSFVVIRNALAGWVPVAATLPDDIPNRLLIQISGDSSYAAGGEVLDLSDYFTEIDGGGSGYPVTPQGSLWTRLAADDVSDPGAVRLVALDGAAQVAGGTNLSSAKWRILLTGRLHFAA
jgi:hypothetical protein